MKDVVKVYRYSGVGYAGEQTGISPHKAIRLTSKKKKLTEILNEVYHKNSIFSLILTRIYLYDIVFDIKDKTSQRANRM